MNLVTLGLQVMMLLKKLIESTGYIKAGTIVDHWWISVVWQHGVRTNFNNPIMGWQF